MVHWRSEGLVQDSDEDEALALDDTNTNSSPPPSTGFPRVSPLGQLPEPNERHTSHALRSASIASSGPSYRAERDDDANVDELQQLGQTRIGTSRISPSLGVEAKARDQFMLHISPETSQKSSYSEPTVHTPHPEALSSPLSEPDDTILTPNFSQSKTWRTTSLQSSTDLRQGEQDDSTDIGGMDLPITENGNHAASIDVPAWAGPSDGPLEHDRMDFVDSRRFRKRTALQEHPYTLEGLLYRQSFRSRGLPYQRLHQEVVPIQEESQEYGTQVDADLSASQQSSSQQRGPSSPRTPSSQHGSPPTPLSDEDAIPDFSALLRPQSFGHVRVGNKRRRTELQRVTSSGRPSRPESPCEGIVDRPQKATAVLIPERRFRMPPGLGAFHTAAHTVTPPKTASVQYNRSYSPEQSPKLSRRQTILIDDDDDLEQELTGVSSSQDRIDLTRGTQSSPDPEPRRDAMLRRVERRMRGVLPASWLKLDMNDKSHVKSTQRSERQNDRSPERAQQRGVARPIARLGRHGDRATNSTNAQTQLQTTDLAEGPGESESVERSDSPGSFSVDILGTTFADPDPGAGFEEDIVDPMAPTSGWARTHHTTVRKRKRQSRLTDSFVLPDRILKDAGASPNRRPVEGKSSKKPKRQAPGSKHQKRQRPTLNVPQSFPPRLGILDVTETSATIPEFIRIAKRQARRRPDQGRHSPRAKYISLQSKQEGLEVDDVLREWKQGRLRKPDGSGFAKRVTRPPPENQHEVAIFQDQAPTTKFNEQRLEGHRSSQTSKNTTRPRVRQSKLSSALETDAQVPGGYSWPSVIETTHSNVPVVSHPKPTSGLPLAKRQGQLEDLEANVDAAHQRSAFHKNLMRLNRMQQRDTVRSVAVQSAACAQQPEPQQAVSGTAHSGFEKTSARQEHSRPRRMPKKRKPKRLDLGQIEVHEPAEDTDITELVPHTVGLGSPGAPSVEILGLAPYGSSYTTDFGVGPLQVGVSFRPSTFIGSHGLKSALSLDRRKLDCSSGGISVYVGGQLKTLDSWTENTAVDIKTISEEILRAAEVLSLKDSMLPHTSEAALAQHLRYIIDYVSEGLNFLDPIDRRSCLTTLATLSSRMFEALSSGLRCLDADVYDEFLTALYLLVLLQVQIVYLSQHHVVDDAIKARCQSLLQQGVAKLNDEVIRSQGRLQSFYDLSNIRLAREYGIKDDAVVIQAVLVAFHSLRWLRMPGLNFWSLLGDSLSETLTPDCNDIRPLEKIWHFVFMIVPLLEMNVAGVLKPGSRHDLENVATEDCNVLKQVLSQTFELYSKQPNAPTINSYLRTALARSHRLVKLWSWRKCEPILNCAFDFFARNNLHSLQNETSTGSCRFLEDLNGPDSLPQLEPSDTSFDIFLKMMANGLVQLRHVYPAKKIKNIVWRFVPNHGRMHIKDENLKREDLDALSNHHNLLVVLYYASPSGLRPSLNTLRNLVDFKSSHAEVCKLNVRAWANLARFQTSTDEPSRAMEPFRGWLNDIIDGCLSQHRAAKAEAEAFLQSHGHIVSANRVEETVLSNQRSIGSVLQTLLSTLRAIMVDAKSQDAAQSLFEGSFVPHIFTIFDAKRSSASQTVMEILSVYEAYFLKCENPRKSDVSQSTSEDSQDYGEWPSDDEVDGGAPKNSLPLRIEHVADDLQVWSSNAFGAESAPEEQVLLRTVKVLCCAAIRLVHSKVRDWSFYLDLYGRGSWQQLRDTDQTRKYGPAFLAAILESDPMSFVGNRTAFLTSWLSSLVERESTLKFQHRITSALLNANPGDPALQNLPFVRDSVTKHFDIGLDELRERRLSLISCVLSNLHTHHDKRNARQDGDRHALAAIVTQVMDSMKKHFQELQSTSSTRSSYVDFVQSVVQFLQQYTADICPIDKFFVEDGPFPLPAEDPLYVVGRLRAYHLTAQDSAAQKKLVMFVQTVFERAAAEHQHVYLASQLGKSVENILEQAGATGPSLRRLLLIALLPVYIGGVGTSDIGWLIAKPALTASSELLDKLLCCINLQDVAMLSSARDMATTVLCAADEALYNPRERIWSLTKREHAFVIAHFMMIGASALSALDFAGRCNIEIGTSKKCIIKLHSLAVAIRTGETGGNATAPSSDSEHRRPDPGALADMRNFAERELTSALSRAWSRTGDEYSIWRHGRRETVATGLGSWEEENAALEQAAIGFLRALRRMPAFRDVCDGRDGCSDLDRDWAGCDVFV